MDFLSSADSNKGRWRNVDADVEGIEPKYHWTGRGRDAIEVAFAEATARPSFTDVREVWQKRHGRGAAPLLVVIEYPAPGGSRALVCGPSGEAPAVVDLDVRHAERLAAAALAEANRHLAIGFLRDALDQGDQSIAGVRNRGLLATHELKNGVPQRSDWDEAVTKGEKLLGFRDHDLVRALGYRIEAVGQYHVLRTGQGNKRVVAVFLRETEQPDEPAARYDGQTPVTYALSHAEEENLPWVMAVRGGKIRLYATTTSGAVGQRGRAETFLELDLALLPSGLAGYLTLLFSSEALASGGTFYDIQEASRDFVAGLSDRLRERVYGAVVPRLAVAIATELGGTSEQDLQRHYRTALTILFRLLFLSYAEDSKLLPLHRNAEYTAHSLKSVAHSLTRAIYDEADLGFDNPVTGRLTEKPDHAQSDLWNTCRELFHAVDKGHARWGVPAYNGGLFSRDPEVNPVGRIIDELTLSNAEFGPVLTALLLDQSPDELVGPIDFRSLSVREFGTIYEGLLESELSLAEQDLTLNAEDAYVPAKPADEVKVHTGDVYLHNRSGQRKSTGSYFTKPFAVDHLLDHSLMPALEEHLDRVRELVEKGREADAADALFDFRVADISMGSGHFLTAVVDRVEARISSFLTKHPIPPVAAELDALRQAALDALEEHGGAEEIETASLLRRLIARRCVYGVDLNPISVELARVAMWIHTFVPGLPLSFLDHNLVVGDSLTGIGTIREATDVMVQVEGLQEGLFDDPLRARLREAEQPLRRLAKLVDATPRDIEAARRATEEVREAVDSVTAFFDVTVAYRLGKTEQPQIDSPDDLLMLTEDPARATAKELRSLHFPIAFPEVFLRENPGFDVILGNPPWEEATLEEHAFWARHFPGLRALSQRQQEAEKERLRRDRPDLVELYERELAEVEALRGLLSAGPFPGMGTGDADLYKAFSWRFWHLTRQGSGRIGVVLPRSALFAKGSEEFRLQVFTHSDTVDVTTLLNTRGWVFDEAEHRYTIGLVSITHGGGEPRAGSEPSTVVRLRGPYPSLERYQAGMQRLATVFEGDEIKSWTDTASLPLLPNDESVEVFAQLRKSPRLGQNDGKSWRARPYTELHATNDKKLMDLDAKTQPKGFWPVYKGESLNLWEPDTGTYYAWADPKKMVPHLQSKRLRSGRNSRSAFSEFEPTWLRNERTLPCLHPRIAFRDSTNRTNQRTVLAALIPPEVFVANQAPVLLWPRGTMQDQAYLLGVLCSLPLDWYARRFVETHVNYYIFNPFPVPRPAIDDPLRLRAIELAGRLAAPDERFAGWANEVGVDYGPLAEDEKQDKIHELDAVVAHLYGLNEPQLTHIFETFHEGWEFEERLVETMKHFNEWKKRLS